VCTNISQSTDRPILTCFHFSHDSSGIAVERQCLNLCLQECLSDSILGRREGPFGVLNISVIPPSMDALDRIRACGTLIALHMTWDHGLPKSISPFLLAMLLKGTLALQDLEFINNLDHEAAQDLMARPKHEGEEIQLQVQPGSDGQEARHINNPKTTCATLCSWPSG
jgi:hypothetical protein